MRSNGYKPIGVDCDGKTYRVWYKHHRAKDGYVHDFVYKKQQVVNTDFFNGERKIVQVIRESL